VAVFELNNAFNRASGGEGPARAALALILNTSDSSLGDPVERARRISADSKIFNRGHPFATAEFGFVSIVRNLEFGRGEISEFVQFDFPSAVSRVVFLNEVVVHLEDIEFVEEFFRGIGFAIFAHPFNKGTFVVSRQDDTNQAQSKKTLHFPGI